MVGIARQNLCILERFQQSPQAPSPSPDRGGGLDLLPGIPLPLQQWPPTTAPPPPPAHSLPLKITCEAPRKSNISTPLTARPAATGALIGFQALSGVDRRASDLGDPPPGLDMDNLSGTHSSVPPLLKLQQINFIHNFSSPLFAHCSSALSRR